MAAAGEPSARIAIIHDYLNQYGGAERVLEALHALVPAAPVFTSIYDRRAMPAGFGGWDIRTSWMQRLPGWRRLFRAYFPLYPAAFESFDLAGYDVIISSSSAYAKGVIPAPGAFHLCYCHTPMRFAWRTADYVARERLPTPARAIIAMMMTRLRTWDVVAAQRVDQFVANSRVVAERIRRYYRREARIIAPPVDLPPFTPCDTEAFYLAGGRLVPYKRLDLAVRACSQLGVPLRVFGDGRDRAALEALAGPTVSFLGRVSEAGRRDLMARCRGFLFPGEEDFGITPVEAMAAGRPVIAYAAGGALDTIVDGVTGRFFATQTVEALMAAIGRSQADHYDPLVIRQHAEGFGAARFAGQVRQELLAAGVTMPEGS
jgi:glycosyltransferase involved in cell wall biosynthesis